MPRRGQWVFVPYGFRAELKPLPQWQTRPPEFYCLKRAEIVCRLYLRDIRPDLYDYCVTNVVLPPPRLRKWRLEKWIEDHRTAARALVTFPGRDVQSWEIPGTDRIRKKTRLTAKPTR